MPQKKKIRIPEGQKTLFQVIRQTSNPNENRNDREETPESPADLQNLSQSEEQESESETTSSAAASTKSKVPSENVHQESEKNIANKSA